MRDIRRICRKEIATISKIASLVHCRENEEEDDEDEEEEEKKQGDEEDDEDDDEDEEEDPIWVVSCRG